MATRQKKFHAIPTNIITGFLGAGKTSAILGLLRKKPADERWAILVNEFGEIGLDGRLMEGSAEHGHGVFIREVAGGCMCCTAGLSMSVALNRLITEADPDRLLIEPTGLGHPREVMETLQPEHYAEVLLIQKTVTLVDARKLSNPRYTSHPTFVQQIAIADLIVGNKVDLYEQGDAARLADFARAVAPPDTPITFAEYGAIELGELDGPPAHRHAPADSEEHQHAHGHAHEHDHGTIDSATITLDQGFPESGIVKAANQGEGYHSIGWKFHPAKVFDRAALFALLPAIKADRLKAIFITQEGIFGFNRTSDGLVVGTMDESMDSRIEILSETVDNTLEQRLLSCIIDS